MNLDKKDELAKITVECFLKAAVKANPSGKQHAFAAFNPPEGVLVEIKEGPSAPVSYANAFAEPVPEKSKRGLIGESIAKLGQHANDLIVGYGIKAERFWFSPNRRYPLTWIDKKKKDFEQEQPLPELEEFGNFDELVKSVMEKISTEAEK